MILTKVRIAIAVAGLLGLGFILWRVHDALAEQRVRAAVGAFQEQMERETRKQVADEEREQDQQRRDTVVSQAAARTARAGDWSDCPSLPAGYSRMLNEIGKPVTARKFAGEVSGAASTSGN